ncbi:hypothetical protein CAOG_09093, partial [Capsaspora owczarzaki ATCC 30864]|uniref:hypothetical protein n=1 Tax=Capsaspora owczarzaki (strain ATCC 30864) TaxID=595528 RepID=UPI00035250A6
DKVAFLDQLSDLIKSATQPNDDEPRLPAIIGGDFNNTPNISHLYVQPEPSQEPRSATQANHALKDFINKHALEDAWLLNHHADDPVEYTRWPSKNQTHRASRIDLMLLSSNLPLTIKSTATRIYQHSDHRGVCVNLVAPSAEDRCTPPFKLNDTILEHAGFCGMVLNEIAELARRPDPENHWTAFKADVAWLAQCLCGSIAKDRAKALAQASRKLKIIEGNLLAATSPAEAKLLAAERAEQEARVKAELEHRAQGARVRSAKKWRTEGEHPTSFYFSLEKQSQKATHIPMLLVDGKEVTDAAGITDAQRDFYAKLYAHVPIDPAAARHILSHAKPNEMLDDEDHELMSRPLEAWEIVHAINKTAPGKSPGPDGLGTAFYKKFKHELAPILAAIANRSLENGRLPEYMQDGFVKLLYKKGPRSDLGNYRPISLLNCDFKLLTKAVIARLQLVVNDIIPLNQNGFVTSRTIDGCVHLTRDVIDLCNTIKTPGVIAMTDASKAFDKVSHDFLYAALRAYGVGPGYINMIKLYNTNGRSAMVYQGRVSDHFPIQRSVRQGGCDSPTLFAFYACAIVDYITYGTKLKLLRIPSSNLKADRKRGRANEDRPDDLVILPTLFADDSSYFLASPADVPNLLNELKFVGTATNLEINAPKTTIIPLGPTATRKPPPDLEGLEWVGPNSTTRYLGVMLGHGDLTVANFGDLLDKLHGQLSRWLVHGPSLPGRVLIANTIALSKVWYRARFVPLSSEQTAKLTRIIDKFLWHPSKWPRTHQANVAAPIKSVACGLGLIPVRRHLKALLAQAALAWCQPLVIKASSDFIGISAFWHKAFEAWHELRPELQTPACRDEALAHPLWDSPDIQDGGKPLWWPSWILNGYMRVRDLRRFIGNPAREEWSPLSLVQSFTNAKYYNTLHEALDRSQLSSLVEQDSSTIPSVQDLPWCWAQPADDDDANPKLFRVVKLRTGSPLTSSSLGAGQVFYESENALIAPAQPGLVLLVTKFRLATAQHATVVYWRAPNTKPEPNKRGKIFLPRKQLYHVGRTQLMPLIWSNIVLNGVHSSVQKPLQVTSHKLKLKTLRQLLTPRPSRPDALQWWINKVGYVPFESLASSIRTSLVTSKQASLLWRIAHRTNRLGADWLETDGQALRAGSLSREEYDDRIATGRYDCAHCKHDGRSARETWHHILVRCHTAQAVWETANAIFQHAHSSSLPRFDKALLFGPFPTTLARKKEMRALATILYHLGRWAIWRTRCEAKINNTFTPSHTTFIKLVHSRALQDIVPRAPPADSPTSKMWGKCIVRSEEKTTISLLPPKPGEHEQTESPSGARNDQDAGTKFATARIS